MTQDEQSAGGVRVPLTRGLTAVIDEADAERVRARKWNAQKGGHTWYAYTMVRREGVQRSLSMHRFILEVGDDELIDHRNGDGLDNRRANLRSCSHAENLRNQRKRDDATSRFKGVHRAANGRWRVEIEQNGERLTLGTFLDEERAARQYDRAARIFFGSFARTNATLGLL